MIISYDQQGREYYGMDTDLYANCVALGSYAEGLARRVYQGRTLGAYLDRRVVEVTTCIRRMHAPDGKVYDETEVRVLTGRTGEPPQQPANAQCVAVEQQVGPGVILSLACRAGLTCPSRVPMPKAA